MLHFTPDNRLSADDIAKRDIKKDAFHEVIHLLLSYLAYLGRSNNKAKLDEIENEEERLVLVFENTVYRALDKTIACDS